MVGKYVNTIKQFKSSNNISYTILLQWLPAELFNMGPDKGKILEMILVMLSQKNTLLVLIGIASLRQF